jgi:hypothetical protein
MTNPWYCVVKLPGHEHMDRYSRKLQIKIFGCTKHPASPELQQCLRRSPTHQLGLHAISMWKRNKIAKHDRLQLLFNLDEDVEQSETLFFMVACYLDVFTKMSKSSKNCNSG